MRNGGPESVPLNPSGGEPDLHPFNSKNRLSSLRLRMIATSTVICKIGFVPLRPKKKSEHRLHQSFLALTQVRVCHAMYFYQVNENELHIALLLVLLSR